jgi:hypothetical protein
MKSSEPSRDYRGRFFPPIIEVNIDGVCETWELERTDTFGRELEIKYKLKDKTIYKVDV